MASAGVAFAVTLNVAVLAGATLAGYRWLWQSSDAAPGPGTPEDWYREASELAHEVQRVAETTEAVADPDAVQRRLIPLASRIRSHVRAAPAGVDGHHVQQLYDIGETCYAVGMDHTTRAGVRTGDFLEDRLDDLGEQAAAFESDVGPRTGTTG